MTANGSGFAAIFAIGRKHPKLSIGIFAAIVFLFALVIGKEKKREGQEKYLGEEILVYRPLAKGERSNLTGLREGAKGATEVTVTGILVYEEPAYVVNQKFEDGTHGRIKLIVDSSSVVASEVTKIRSKLRSRIGGLITVIWGRIRMKDSPSGQPQTWRFDEGDAQMEADEFLERHPEDRQKLIDDYFHKQMSRTLKTLDSGKAGGWSVEEYLRRHPQIEDKPAAGDRQRKQEEARLPVSSSTEIQRPDWQEEYTEARKVVRALVPEERFGEAIGLWQRLGEISKDPLLHSRIEEEIKKVNEKAVACAQSVVANADGRADARARLEEAMQKFNGTDGQVVINKALKNLK
jgi:hypothetical protein